METAQQIQMQLEECIIKLKRMNPEMEYFFLLIPFDHRDMTHLSPEQKTEVEKRTIHRAKTEFEKALIEMNIQAGRG